MAHSYCRDSRDCRVFGERPGPLIPCGITVFLNRGHVRERVPSAFYGRNLSGEQGADDANVRISSAFARAWYDCDCRESEVPDKLLKECGADADQLGDLHVSFNVRGWQVKNQACAFGLIFESNVVIKLI